MAIKTAVYWGESSILDPEDRTKVDDEMARLISLNATDGSHTVAEEKIVRSWATIDQAQDWTNFLNALKRPPISIEIVQD